MTDNQFLYITNLIEEVIAEMGTLIAVDEYPSALQADISMIFTRLDEIEARLKAPEVAGEWVSKGQPLNVNPASLPRIKTPSFFAYRVTHSLMSYP